ncbi:MAG TPA: hypothetical protein VFQ60_04005 [Patescibacteria group bacterium]|nr:hypothetical protein [Patescibacteria group bacterium]
MKRILKSVLTAMLVAVLFLGLLGGLNLLFFGALRFVFVLEAMLLGRGLHCSDISWWPPLVGVAMLAAAIGSFYALGKLLAEHHKV